MRIKNKARFIFFMSIIFLGIFFIISMLTTKVFSHETMKYNRIIVSNGDTLWGIAAEMNGNINRNIYEIKKINNLKQSNIYVGQELLVPIM